MQTGGLAGTDQPASLRPSRHLEPSPSPPPLARLAQITNELCDVLAAQAAAAGGSAEVDVAEAAMRCTLDLIGDVGYG